MFLCLFYILLVFTLTNVVAKIKPNIVGIIINMNKLNFSNKLDLM